MSAQTTDELRDFHRFVTDKLRNGSAHLSPEESLDEWREMHPDPEIDEAEVAAIQAAIDDMLQGDKGRPADDVLADIRSQLGLPQ